MHRFTWLFSCVLEFRHNHFNIQGCRPPHSNGVWTCFRMPFKLQDWMGSNGMSVNGDGDGMGERGVWNIPHIWLLVTITKWFLNPSQKLIFKKKYICISKQTQKQNVLLVQNTLNNILSNEQINRNLPLRQSTTFQTVLAVCGYL